jgi:hypothetical protein
VDVEVKAEATCSHTSCRQMENHVCIISLILRDARDVSSQVDSSNNDASSSTTSEKKRAVVLQLQSLPIGRKPSLHKQQA